MSCTKHDDDMQPDCVGCCPPLSGPTGQDRSADGRPPKSIGDLLRIAYSAAGKAESMGIRRMELERLIESMPDLADAIKSMPRETSGQDVAALRAEVERLKADDLVRRVAYSELASVNAFLREQLATVTRERDAYERQSCAQAAELLDARKEIATARERIAALEALADRWEALPKLRSPNSDAYRTAKICAKQLRAALTGGKPHDESIRDDSEHFT
jgi:chromosome segregation ATPase